MAHADPKQQTSVKTNINVTEPPMFRLIYLNDNQTAMEFVVHSLVEHFNYIEPTAEQIANDIHLSGSAVVAVLPYEMAEQKGIEITMAARSAGYPLQIKIEPDLISL